MSLSCLRGPRVSPVILKQFWNLVNILASMTFLEECAIIGGICHYWRNVSFLDEYDIFGGIGHIWMNVPFFWNVPSLEECVIF